jgi:hypothetical protein
MVNDGTGDDLAEGRADADRGVDGSQGEVEASGAAKTATKKKMLRLET